MFTDLEEYITENLGYKSRGLDELAALEKRAAHGAAFFAAFAKWRKENPVAASNWNKWRYKKKKQDPVWWANRQAANKAYKDRMKHDKEYLRKRREKALATYHKNMADPVWRAKKNAQNRTHSRKKKLAIKNKEYCKKYYYKKRGIIYDPYAKKPFTKWTTHKKKAA
jgi:hypothetical protein